MTETLSENAMKAAKRNIPVLVLAQTFGAAASPVITALGGLVGRELAPNPLLITLPVFSFALAAAIGTLPAAYLMARLGRPRAYLIGAVLGVAGGSIASLGLMNASFIVFCLGTFVTGFYASHVQSYRFASTDGLPANRKARAVSLIMFAGLAAAVIGPQIVILTRNIVPASPFVGAFLSQTMLAVLAFVVLTRLVRIDPPRQVEHGEGERDEGRTVWELLRTPAFLLAVATGVAAFGIKNFMLTAAPIAMVEHGLSTADAALGVQWHVLSMYAPSFFTGRLIERYGAPRIAAVGLILILAAAVLAIQGQALFNFWGALVLLGLGWNLAFIGATTMVALSHRPTERARAQGLNDLTVLGCVAFTALASGGILSLAGWNAVALVTFPVLIVVLVPLVWVSVQHINTSSP